MKVYEVNLRSIDYPNTTEKFNVKAKYFSEAVKKANVLKKNTTKNYENGRMIIEEIIYILTIDK